MAVITAAAGLLLLVVWVTLEMVVLVQQDRCRGCRRR
jgi:hypothetical protein